MVDTGKLMIRDLPPCPHLIWAFPNPLNKSAPTNLYKSQKLLSVQVEADLPVFSHDSKAWFPTAEYIDHDEIDVFPILLILITVPSVLFIIYRYFFLRKRPRRKRSNKLGRFLSMLKVPNV